MPKDVDEYVAENTKRLRSVDSRFVQVDSNRSRELSFGSNFFEVDVEVELYKRSTGDQIVVGHPSESKGFGRGTFGDDRGVWSLVTDAEVTAEFTKSGRRAAAESLNGETGAVSEGVIGVGTSPASTGDTSLENEVGRTEAFASTTDNTTRSTAVYDATSVFGSTGELGIVDVDGRLLARVTVDVDDSAVGDTDEFRGVVLLTFTGDGNGSAVVTSDGEVALAESIESEKTVVGPSEFAFGSGSTKFDKSDSSLTSEVTRKGAGRDPGRDRLSVFTQLSESDMAGVNTDLSEVGLFDNQGRMIWATTFRSIPSNSPGFVTEATIVVS